MCRLFIYYSENEEVNFKDILWCCKNSIFKQCFMCDKSINRVLNERDNAINVDGFGIGWYYNDKLYSYHSTKTPWNDKNIKNLSELLSSKLIFAHIRAMEPFSKYIPHDHDCHPFIHDNKMWMHNGIIGNFKLFKKHILDLIDDKIISYIEGSTDSELCYGLFLSFLEKDNVIEAMKKTIKTLDDIRTRYSKKNVVFSMNFAFTNNDEICCTRYITGSNQDPPSLYMLRKNKNIIISSEKIDDDNSWEIIEKNKMIYIKDGSLCMFDL